MQKNNFFSSLGTGAERGILIENLTLLLSSGLNVSMALLAVQKEIKSKYLSEILNHMSQEVENGSSFWRAAASSNLFPESTISLIKIGEETGRLSENLKIVASQTEKNKEFKSKLKSAMMYPVFVIFLALVISIGISWFILPNLATVFSQMNVKLPLITRLMIDFGKFLGAYGYIVVPSFLLFLSALIYFIFIFSKTKFIGQSIVLATPGISKLVQEVELARFGYLLGTLLGAGLPVEQALESIKSSSTFFRYQKFYTFLKDYVEEGNSFQKSFASYKKVNKIMPYSIQQMIIAGEQSGNLADILVKIGESYNDKTEMTTKNLVVILEPILLIVVWLGVVGVALSIILPIYSLIGGYNSLN
ncbi:MAG: type II secretion system F family protein [Patescibacteria group bacterium]